jgi:thiosulfate/3-mercaptopyruvate sulfurtransferase
MNSVDYTTLISAEDLSAIINNDDLVVLDCRFSLGEPDLGRRQYLEGHIPGAFYLDINLDLSSPVIKGVTGRHPLPHPLVLASALRTTGLNNDSQVVVYDQSNGMYAARAWWLLNWLGHQKVALLNGGFAAWAAKQLPADNQWPPPKQGTFEYLSPRQKTLSVQEIAREKHKLIDSRDYIRFTGESETIDPIAGHIPGAVCLPFLDNTDANGFWKPADQLRKKFEHLDQNETQPPVFYCGSGVTACHNILAYKIATGQSATLYPGSYSEWINYYPVATGE